MNTPKIDKKKALIIAVFVILLLNIVWTVAQNKFTPKLDEVQKAMAVLEQRIAKLEQGGFSDVADLKSDFAEFKAISAELSNRLAQSAKAEEDQLAYLEAQVEAQKARIEALKKIKTDN